MELKQLFGDLPKAERQETLDGIAQHLSEETSIAVNFICTHNSRRSHLCATGGTLRHNAFDHDQRRCRRNQLYPGRDDAQ